MRINLNQLDLGWRGIVALLGLASLILLVAANGKAISNVPRQLFVHDSTMKVNIGSKQDEILKELKKMNCYTFNDHTKGDWRTCEEDR